MEEIIQKVFKDEMISKLHANISKNEGLLEYYVDKIEYPIESVSNSNLRVRGTLPNLEPTVDADSRNAELFHQHFFELNSTQATDRRLWAYLSHMTFREYTLKRWPIKPINELKSEPKLMQAAKKTINDRWLLAGGAHGLVRNSLSRLWWAANLTYAPWVREPKIFENLKFEDNYVYTKLLMSKSAIFIAITDRSLSGCPKVMFAILESLRLLPLLERRETLSPFMKEINLIFGYRRLEVLEFSEILDVVMDTANYCLSSGNDLLVEA